jgi:hypothetical protein
MSKWNAQLVGAGTEEAVKPLKYSKLGLSIAIGLEIYSGN